MKSIAKQLLASTINSRGKPQNSFYHKLIWLDLKKKKKKKKNNKIKEVHDFTNFGLIRIDALKQNIE